MAQQLLLVRHAAVAPQHAGRFCGSSDLPIDPGQANRAAALATDLIRRRPRSFFRSPLRRVRQTCEILSAGAGFEGSWREDADLREIDFGQWEGLTFEQIAAGHADLVERWANFREDFAFPGGESIAGFLHRVRAAAARLASDPADVVLAVTHGGVIRAMICQLLGLSPRCYLLFNIKPATCTIIDLFDGRGILSGINEPWPAEVA